MATAVKEPEIIHLDRSALSSITAIETSIAEMRQKYMPLKITDVDDKKQFDAVHEARMEVRTLRIDVEKKRKELKADALEFGKLVDSSAKKITGMIEPIEEHLQQQEDIVTAEKERRKREAEEKRQAVLQSRVDQLTAVGGACSIVLLGGMTDSEFSEVLSKATAEHAAKVEADRIAAEARAAEEKRLAEERAKLEAERKEQERIAAEQRAAAEAERKKIDEERRAVEAEKLRLEQEERRRKEVAEAAEKARIETEQRLKREAEEKAKAEADRIAAEKRSEELKPVKLRLQNWCEQIVDLSASVPKGAPEAAEKRIKTLLKECCKAICEEIEAIK